MAKKLKLVLRDPVKLYDDKSTAPKLPSPYDNRDSKSRNSERKQLEKNTTKKKKDNESKGKSAKNKSSINNKLETENIKDYREQMSERVRQIWECFCEKSKEDNDLKNSFAVTRSEVMEKAEVGSTNTYRNALKKFQEMGLLTIELRPGVVNGSMFHLTKLGIEQVEKFYKQ
jgi:hypothetical protein